MKNIAVKMLQVMAACKYIHKGAENKEQKYKYVSAANVAEKVNEALNIARLICVPEYSIVSERDKPTKSGALWQLVTVQLKLQIIDADSGEVVTITSLGTGTDAGDKAIAKAQTMAYKYAWLTALCIETGDDPEDPATDRAFSNPAGPPAALAMNNPRIQAIYQLWQGIGWDTNLIPGYLVERFKKPIDQLTDAELFVVSEEASQYYKQRQVPQ